MIKVIVVLLVVGVVGVVGVVALGIFVSVGVSAAGGGTGARYGGAPDAPANRKVAGVAATESGAATGRLSPEEVAFLVVLGLIAVAVAVISLAYLLVDGVWLPLLMWAMIFVLMRERARNRARRQAAETARALKQQKVLLVRRRSDEFGKDGVELLDKAERAIRRIVSSEAAREGWLGELDFRPDLSLIRTNLRSLRLLRAAMTDLSMLPHRNSDDIRTLQDAERVVAERNKSIRERVDMLGKCAREAEQIDRTLREEREQARVAARRDDALSRLHGMLYGVQAAPLGTASDAADAVTARVSAFRELKGHITEQRQHQGDDAMADGGKPAALPADKPAAAGMWQGIVRWVSDCWP